MSILADKIRRAPSKVFKSCMYYITMIILLLDPVYLSIPCGFFGGGDMNGIALLIPETAAQIGYGVLIVINAVVFWEVLLSKYTLAFSNNGSEFGEKRYIFFTTYAISQLKESASKKQQGNPPWKPLLRSFLNL